MKYVIKIEYDPTEPVLSYTASTKHGEKYICDIDTTAEKAETGLIAKLKKLQPKQPDVIKEIEI